MFKVTVFKEGSSWTGGLYPESSLDSSLEKIEAMGYTVVMVSRQVSA
jgi:hypothetical protein